ncbi:MBL fold metallo-hydrolase [Candidatus Saccharibacteria bacterium]|nr:MBL fold metallo-hydrolase [Candidatus Saccharibacteria bacterium]
MKQATIVIDDNLEALGLKSVMKPDSIALYTSEVPVLSQARLVISDPGEYEVSGISIFGIAARGHMDETDKQTATIYKIQFDDLRVAVIGHIHPDLTEDHLEEIGTIDILITPVGGNSYTLDAIGALQIIKKIEPKLIIPTHYDDSKIKYPVPQQSLAEALKGLSMEPKETLAKFKPKPADFGEAAQLIILERQ